MAVERVSGVADVAADLQPVVLLFRPELEVLVLGIPRVATTVFNISAPRPSFLYFLSFQNNTLVFKLSVFVLF